MEYVRVVLAALLSYAALFVCAKVVGRKQIAQLNFIDYITGITIGSIAAELATELETPTRPLIAMGVYAVATWAMARVGMRCMRARKFIDGTPTIILRGGQALPGKHEQGKARSERVHGHVPRAGLFQPVGHRHSHF